MKNLFIGPTIGNNKCNNAITGQWEHVIKIWKDKPKATFGIERLFLLFLVSIQFIMPSLYIRYLSGLKGMICRKITVEIYTILKVALPIILLSASIKNNYLLALIIYFGIETVIYVNGILFLQGLYSKPISYKRSVLLDMVNYFEIILDFAYIYYAFGSLKGVHTNIDYLYFSVVTSATVGFGDFIPILPEDKIIVISQILISLFFTLMLLAFFMQNFNENNTWKTKKNKTRIKNK